MILANVICISQALNAIFINVICRSFNVMAKECVLKIISANALSQTLSLTANYAMI